MATLPQEYNARLTRKQQLTPTVLHLTFEATKPLLYQPGQYASLLIATNRRPMSFATPAQGTHGEFLVDISPGGIASRWAQEIEPGHTLRFLSPYGQFTLNQETSRARVFIATGTGIAPIRAQLQADTLRLPTTLIFGTRTSTLRFFDNEFATFSRKAPNFTFLPVSKVPAPAWSGKVGHVANIALSHVANIAQAMVYICGSPTLVQETKAMLVDHGVLANQIHTERFHTLHS